MLQIIYDAVKGVIEWLLNLIITVFSYAVDLVLDMILAVFPTLDTTLDSLISVMGQVSYFVPLGYGFTLLFALYSVRSITIIIRSVHKFITTLAGS